MKKLLTAFTVGIFIIAGLFVAQPSFAQQANTASVLQSLLEQLSALQAQVEQVAQTSDNSQFAAIARVIGTPPAIAINSALCSASHEAGKPIDASWTVSTSTRSITIAMVAQGNTVPVVGVKSLRVNRVLTGPLVGSGSLATPEMLPAGNYELFATVSGDGRSVTSRSCAFAVTAAPLPTVAVDNANLCTASFKKDDSIPVSFTVSNNIKKITVSLIEAGTDTRVMRLTPKVVANKQTYSEALKITSRSLIGRYQVLVEVSTPGKQFADSKSCAFSLVRPTVASRPASVVQRASGTAADSARSCPGGYAQTLDTSKVGQIANSVAPGWLEGNGYLKTYSNINAGVDGVYVYGVASAGFNDSCADGIKMFFSGVLDATDRNRDACVVEIPMIACIRGTTYIGQNTTCNYPNTMVSGVCTPPPVVVAKGTIQGFRVNQSASMAAIGAGSEVRALRIGGGYDRPAPIVKTESPYGFTLDPGTYQVSADTPPGYTLVGYTLCTSGTSCHTATPTPGESVTVTVASGSSNDLWWHFTPVANGTIQGYVVHRYPDSNPLHVFPSGSVTVRANGGSAGISSINPYSLSLAPGTYTIDVIPPQGFGPVFGYTMCARGVTSCHTGPVTRGTTATVTVTAGGVIDLYWHFGNASDMTLAPSSNAQMASMLESARATLEQLRLKM